MDTCTGTGIPPLFADLSPKVTKGRGRNRLISRKRIRHVLEHCLLIFEEDPLSAHPWARDKRLVFLGEDSGGIALEVIAVETSHGNLLAIHAMELRARYSRAYEEVRRWSK